METMSGCDLGRLWVGDLTEKLDAVKAAEPAKFADAVATVMGALADYGSDDFASGTASRGPAGSLAFGGVQPDPTTSDGARAEVEMNRRTGDAMMAAAKKLWANNGKPVSQGQVTAGTRDALPRRGLSTRATPEDINEMNRRFYAAQPTHRYGSEFGKG